MTAAKKLLFSRTVHVLAEDILPGDVIETDGDESHEVKLAFQWGDADVDNHMGDLSLFILDDDAAVRHYPEDTVTVRLKV